MFKDGRDGSIRPASGFADGRDGSISPTSGSRATIYEDGRDGSIAPALGSTGRLLTSGSIAIMYEDGRDGSMAPASGPTGRLLFTLWKPFKPGVQTAYPHAVVKFPNSYHEAQLEAAHVFAGHLPRKVKPSTIFFKCAVRRANGATVWCVINPAEWNTTICNGDELGVFLPDDLNALYEAVTRSTTDRNSAAAQRQTMISLSYEPPINGFTRPLFPEKRILVYAPGTLMELKELAKSQFGMQQHANQIRIKRTVGTFVTGEVEILEDHYSQFITAAQEPIELTAY